VEKQSGSKHSGSGTIYQRGDIWWVKIHVDGRPVYESSKSIKHQDAVKLRDRLLAKKSRGEISGGSPNKVLISELLDDVLQSDVAESTRYIWRLVIEKNLRPFFGKLRAAALTTDKMDEYRVKRKKAGRADATVNRELTILRTAFNNGRKRTPPKVYVVPYFPMVSETHVRQGFLTDNVYAKLLDALEPELRPLFAAAYITGVRKSELLACEWSWVDFDSGIISLPAQITKTKDGRTVPITDGDMRNLLLAAKQERDENWPDSQWVFNRSGKKIKDFRRGWAEAVKAVGVPDLTFHDLRRSAVRNMRRAGVPQIIRMAISGHKTDSMERRYNIVDGEDIEVAKKLMSKRKRQ
jgi:integrase